MLLHNKFNYTRRFLGGLQPLCGIGVISRINVISKPADCNDLIDVSRPDPGPCNSTSTCFIPWSNTCLATFSDAFCAAKGVPFLIK